jgi:predicted secreted protein
MAKAAGRLAVLSKNSVAIGGVKVVGMKYAGEPIDVTDRDSNGIVALLSVAKTQQLTLSVEGFEKDAVLRDIAFTPGTSKLLTDLTFKFADALTGADTISGNFFMTSYENSNPDNDASKFSCEFVSSEGWTLG